MPKKTIAIQTMDHVVRLVQRQYALMMEQQRQKRLGLPIVDQDQRVAILMWDTLDLYLRHREEAAAGYFHVHGLVVVLAVLAGAWSEPFVASFQHNSTPQNPGVAISIWHNLAFLVRYHLTPETLAVEEGISIPYRSHDANLSLSQAESQEERTREHRTTLLRLMEELLQLMPLLQATAQGVRTPDSEHQTQRFKNAHELPVLATLAFHGHDRIALQKMRRVCIQAIDYDLSEPTHRFAMLQALVTLGEYSCDRHLTHATKALDNSIDWPLLGRIRLVLCHPAYAWSLSDQVMACIKEDFHDIQKDLAVLATMLDDLERLLLKNTPTLYAQERHVGPRHYLPQPVQVGIHTLAEKAYYEGLITAEGRAAFLDLNNVLDLDPEVEGPHIRAKTILSQHLTPELRVEKPKHLSREKTEEEQRASAGRTKLFKTLLRPLHTMLEKEFQRAQYIEKGFPKKHYRKLLDRQRQNQLKHLRVFHRTFLRGITSAPKSPEPTNVRDMLRRARYTWDLLFEHLPSGVSIDTLAQQEPVFLDQDTLHLPCKTAKLNDLLGDLKILFQNKAKSLVSSFFYTYEPPIFIGGPIHYKVCCRQPPTITSREREMLKAIEFVQRYHRTVKTQLQLPIHSLRNPKLHAAIAKGLEAGQFSISLGKLSDDGTIHPVICRLSPMHHEVASMYSRRFVPPSETMFWSIGGLPIGLPVESLEPALIARGRSCQLYLQLLDQPTTQPMLTYLLCYLRSVMLPLSKVLDVPAAMLNDLRKCRNHSVHGHHLLDASDALHFTEYLVAHWSNLARTLPTWLIDNEARLARFHHASRQTTTYLGALLAPPSYPSSQTLATERHVLRSIERLLSEDDGRHRQTLRCLLGLVRKLGVKGPAWKHHRGVWYALDRFSQDPCTASLTEAEVANLLKELQQRLLTCVKGELSSAGAGETPIERYRRWHTQTHLSLFPVLNGLMQRLETHTTTTPPVPETSLPPRSSDDSVDPIQATIIKTKRWWIVCKGWSDLYANALRRCNNLIALCRRTTSEADRVTEAQILREVVRLLDVLAQTPRSVTFSDAQCEECLGLCGALLAYTKRFPVGPGLDKAAQLTPSDQIVALATLNTPSLAGPASHLVKGTNLAPLLDELLITLRPRLHAAMLAPQCDGETSHWWHQVDPHPLPLLAERIARQSPETTGTAPTSSRIIPRRAPTAVPPTGKPTHPQPPGPPIPPPAYLPPGSPPPSPRHTPPDPGSDAATLTDAEPSLEAGDACRQQ